MVTNMQFSQGNVTCVIAASVAVRGEQHTYTLNNTRVHLCTEESIRCVVTVVLHGVFLLLCVFLACFSVLRLCVTDFLLFVFVRAAVFCIECLCCRFCVAGDDARCGTWIDR